MYTANLVFGNGIFWIIILLTIIGTISIQFISKQFSFLELCIQIGVVCLIFYISFFITIRNATGIMDKEILSGYVTSATYEESWTERVKHTYTTTHRVGKSSYTTTHTYYTNDYRSPKWYVNTTLGNVNIDSIEYNRLKTLFDNESKISDSHYNQVSIGDGKTYEVSYKGLQVSKVPKDLVYVTQQHDYENLLKVSNSLFVVKAKSGKYNPIPYPYNTGYNCYTRVLNDAKLDNELIKQYNDLLNKYAGKYGRMKEMNPIIYFTDKPQNFIWDLKYSWIIGKKNDIVMVIGVKNNKIDWCEVMCWTKKEIFKITLKSHIESMDLKQVDINIDIIATDINKLYLRMEMKEFNYLINDITIPSKVYKIVLGLWVVLFIGLSITFYKIDLRNN